MNNNKEFGQDQINIAVKQFEENRIRKAKQWGNISRVVIMIYVFLGGGYEIVIGIAHHHVQSSFVFSLMSSFIFVSRIFYAVYSQATKTVWADICGAVIMLFLSFLHVIINRTFL